MPEPHILVRDLLADHESPKPFYKYVEFGMRPHKIVSVTRVEEQQPDIQIIANDCFNSGNPRKFHHLDTGKVRPCKVESRERRVRQMTAAGYFTFADALVQNGTPVAKATSDELFQRILRFAQHLGPSCLFVTTLEYWMDGKVVLRSIVDAAHEGGLLVDWTLDGLARLTPDRGKPFIMEVNHGGAVWTELLSQNRSGDEPRSNYRIELSIFETRCYSLNLQRLGGS